MTQPTLLDFTSKIKIPDPFPDNEMTHSSSSSSQPPENKVPADNKPVSSLNKDNKDPPFEIRDQDHHNWDFFKVTDTFDSYLFGEKRRHQKGHVIKFPVIEAPKYIEKGFLAPACLSGYVWDDLEKTCVEIQGGDKNGNS